MPVSENPDVTRKLAAFACSADYERLPTATIASTKRIILDTIGCAIGAASLPASAIVARAMADAVGPGDATALDTGVRLPLDRAVFVNAQLANALDAEETTLWSGHIASCAVMPALAMAERDDRSGRDLIAAVATAFEVAGRIGLSFTQIGLDPDGRMVLPAVRGHSWVAYAATVAVGRFLGLDADAMRSAFGLTAAVAPLPVAGNWQHSAPPRTMMKYGMFGAFAQAGVMAARLAAHGFTGEPAILDGPNGLWRMLGVPDQDAASMTAGLGEEWVIDRASLKPFPCCRFAHPALDLIGRLVADNGFAADGIDRIRIEVPSAVFGMKMDERRVETPVDAQFCIPYQVAMLLSGVEPGPGWQDPARFGDPSVAALMRRVELVLHPRSSDMVRAQIEGGDRPLRFPYRVTIDGRGRSVDASADDAPGDPWAGRTMSDAALDGKFRAFTRDRLSGERADAALALLRGLEGGRVVPLVAALTSDRAHEVQHG